MPPHAYGTPLVQKAHSKEKENILIFFPVVLGTIFFFLHNLSKDVGSKGTCPIPKSFHNNIQYYLSKPTLSGVARPASLGKKVV